MHLITDYIHPTPRGGHCRIQIYLPEEEERDDPVVICTELRSNEGMSVTNSAEQIAAEVILSNRLPTPVVWIEHYEAGIRGDVSAPASFDLVLFEHYEPREVQLVGIARQEIGKPTWKRLDRATVEVLVGKPLEA